MIMVECEDGEAECISKIEAFNLVLSKIEGQKDRSQVLRILKEHERALSKWESARAERLANDPKIKAFLAIIEKSKASGAVVRMRRPISFSAAGAD